MQQYLFTSERLGFRLWSASDLAPFAEMGSDPDVMEFFPKLLSQTESAQFMERMNTHFVGNGRTFYAVDSLEDGNFIGFIGMIYQTMEAHFTPCTEIGWRLRKDVWGKGYATEGALRCLEYGFSDLGCTEIYSMTSVINPRSERVMQKIGMEKIGEFEHPKLEVGDPLRAHVLYRISKGTH